MWRSRVIVARTARSAYTHGITGFSGLNLVPNIPKMLPKVNYTQPRSQNITSVRLFQQKYVRFFSSQSVDSIAEVEVTDNGNNVCDDGNENSSFGSQEEWKNGVAGVKNTVEMDVFDSVSSGLVGSINDNKPLEVDVEQLERVLGLLQGGDDVGGSFESILDDMNLNLSEEFVARVFDTPSVPGKNLIVFFNWVLAGKNLEDFSVTTKYLDALVRAVSRAMKIDDVYNLYDLVKELGKMENGVVTTEILNALISLFSRLGEGMAGYEVFNKFTDFLCVANADSYYYAIEALCRQSLFDLVGSVYEEMLSEEQLPDAQKVGNIINYFCKAGMVKEAHSVYLLAKQKRRYPPQTSVDLLITSLSDQKKIDADSVHLALKMLEDFSGGEKQKHAIKQFSCVIRGLCRINDLEGAKDLLSKMIVAGPPPGNAVFNSIINSLSKAGDLAEAIKIMRLMEGRGLKPDVFTYSVIMSGYAKGGEMEEAVKILVEAKKNHLKLTPVIYHTIIRGYCKLEQFGNALELFNEMEDYGVRPTADEYNKLIQSLCLKAADWGIATKLMEDMKGKGLHLNEMTKALVRAVKELEEEAVETKEVSV